MNNEYKDFYLDPFEGMRELPNEPAFQDYIAAMGFGEELRFAPGRTTLSPGYILTVGCRYDVRLRYYPEEGDLDPGMVVKFSIPMSWSEPQTDEQKGAGFVQSRSSEGGRSEISLSHNGNMTWWINVALADGLCGSGYIEVAYRNVDIQRFPQIEFNNLRNSFRTILYSPDAKEYSVVPASRTAKPRVQAAPLSRWQIAGPSSVAPGSSIEFRFAAIDYCENKAEPAPSGTIFASLPETPFEPITTTTLLEADRGLGVVSVKAPRESGPFRVFINDRRDRVISRSHTVVVDEKAEEWQVYFGDIHAKTRATDGLGTPRQYFQHLRDVALCDFGAIADHNGGHEASFLEGPFRYRISDDEYREIQAQCEAFNEVGRFATLHAFEQNVIEEYAGHRNIYFRGAAPGLFKGQTLQELYDFLSGYDALIIPHHHVIWNTQVHLDNTEFSRVIEMYSMHCSSEIKGSPLNNWRNWASKSETGISAREILNQGHRMGFIAASDNHNGAPGLSARPSRFTNLAYRGGLAAVSAPSLTREGIFDGLYARRCYATTGARIYLRFQINDQEMGSEVPAGDGLSYRIVVAGTESISSVEFITNLGESRVFEYTGTDYVELSAEVPADAELKWMYVRVTQTDRHMAWSSPIWTDY